jgi:site-specific DNA-methyltransferase (adenine-specific)
MLTPLRQATGDCAQVRVRPRAGPPGYRVAIARAVACAVPKRPPRIATAPPVPVDLREPGPRLAHAGPSGELWRADVMDFLARIPDGSVPLVVTDPPYAIGKAAWDVFPSQDAYVLWCDAWLAEVRRVLTPRGSAYVCGFSEILAEVKARSARRFADCRWLIWSYRNKANLGGDWGRSHESILHLRVARGGGIDTDAVRIPYNAHTTRYPERVQAVSSQYGRGVRRDRWQPHPLGAKPRDVFELPVLCNGMAEKTAHATQKPEALIDTFIRASSAAGDLVVDPFVGSGTTAVVAARLGRHFLCGDADPGYVGVARARIVAAGAPPAAPARPKARR